MGRRIPVVKKKSIASAGSNSHIVTLPRAYIEKIQISVNTAITVSAGSVVANCSIKTIIIRFNGKQIIRITGRSYDDKQSAGIQLIRELEAQKARVALTDDYFVISFPQALPIGDVQLEWTNQSAENIGANAGGTVNAGDHDVEIEISDRKPPTSVVPYITSFNFDDDDSTGDLFHWLNALPFKLRLLLFVTHDSGTRSNTTYASLQILHNGIVLFDGTMAKLTNEGQQKSGLALNTGCFIWSPGKEGLKVAPDSLCLKFNASTGGTDKHIEGIAICW